MKLNAGGGVVINELINEEKRVTVYLLRDKVIKGVITRFDSTTNTIEIDTAKIDNTGKYIVPITSISYIFVNS